MKTIKIFLASSNGLQDERNAIELIVSRENKKFAAKGIQFELVRWEQLPQSFQPKRVQKFFNEKMLECEVMVALFYDRIGDFTYEEFQTAFKSFNKGKNPRHIFVFFKTGQISTEAVTDEFYEVQKLRQKIEHHEQIYCKYENLDELKNKLKEQMDLLVETYKNETSSPQEPPVHNVEPKRTNTSDKPFYRNGIFWLFAIIFVSILSALWIYQSTPYSFTIPNHFLRSDGVLVIHSENWKANQNKHLNVEFDGFKYAKSGKPTEKDNLGNQVWHFRISEHHPPKNYLKDGEHRIRLGFPGKKYSDEVYKICFITKDLIIDAALISQTILPGSLFVNIVPEDAAISFVDDNKTYSKGMALDPGQYKIQGKKKGYESQTKEFSITAGKKSEISINLEPIAPTTKTWTDPTTNMAFVWIPAGCFQMGSPESEAGRGSDEGPVHKVCVDGFWLGKYEVTRGQFSRFITATKYKTDAEKEGSSWGYKDGSWDDVKGYSWKNSGFEQNDSHPVISVSWNDAKAMAKWMSKNSKYTFKLPTEAEWEYACRAGTQTSRFWGDDPDQACKYANVADKSAKKQFSDWSIHNCTDGYVFTAPVGKFLDNPFQLSDMLGNVWEWCEDAYSNDAYKKHRSKNPVISSGNSGAGRVIRGGGWDINPRSLRSANRNNYSPGYRYYHIGFRLLRTR